MPTTATKKKTRASGAKSNGHATLSATQARRLLEAEADVRRRRAKLEEAEAALAKLRNAARARVPVSTDRGEKKKRIRAAVVGGIRIRITPAKTGPRFSLKRYRDAGHEITPEMQDAITPARPYDRWTVKAVGS
jgi:hypothetical protein